MTSTNTLGIRNGNQIIPYGAATKQTKVITTTDTSMLVLAGAGITQTTCSGYFMAYADSAGKWRLRFNIRASGTTSGTARALASIAFSSTYAVKFKNDFYQAVSGIDDTGNLTVVAYAQPNTAIIGLGFPSATSVPAYIASGDVELESEPTWAAANMEGAVNASVYIPPASAGVVGLVNNAVANTAGTPILGKTDGVAVAAGYVGEICTTTERAGTGGSAYQDFNNTAITNTGFTKMIYKSVKKGIYIVSGQSGCFRSDSLTTGELMAYLAVGDTAVINSVNAGISGNNVGTACVTAVIKITTDNTEIQLYTGVGSGVTAASPVHGLSIVRIA